MSFLSHMITAINELEAGINEIEAGEIPYGMPPEAVPMFVKFYRDQIDQMRKYVEFYEHNAPKWEDVTNQLPQDFTEYTGDHDGD